MRTISGIALFLSLLCQVAFAQEDTARFRQWITQNTSKIASVDPANEDYADLQVLKQMIGTSRIVMLGEPTHGDGEVIKAKTRMVKFLHKEMGFDMLVFENGIYDLYKANKDIQSGVQVDVALRNALYPAWTDSKEFMPLIDYLELQRQTGKPMTLAGIDPYQNGTYTAENLIDDLKSFLSRRVPEMFNDTLLYELDEVVSEMGSLPKQPNLVLANMSLESVSPVIFNSAKDSAEYWIHNEAIFQALSVVPNLYPAQRSEVSYWKQILTSINKVINIELDAKKGIEHPAQNPRDWQMAKNLIFLDKLYPDKKIIVWGANYRFVNNIESLKYKQLKAAYPMGEIVSQVSTESNQVFSIAFTAAKGKYGWNNIPPRELISPPTGSIEDMLMKQGMDYGYVNLRSDTAKFRYYCAALYYVPIKGNWANVFDGLFFIQNMTATTMASKSTGGDSRFQIQKAIPVTGTVRDAKTKQPIPYASISIMGTATGTITNSKGNFELKIPLEKADEMLQISALGYKSTTYPILEIVMDKPFIMVDLQPNPFTTEVQNIIIDGDVLTPDKIMKRAIRRLNKNYLRSPFSADFFYRGYRKDNNASVYLLESAMDMYDSKGNKRSDLRGMLRERNFRVNQIKRQNYEDWQGRVHEYITDISQHDIIRSKNNLLNLMRLRYYDLELEQVTWFEEDEVFVIKYKCNKPSFYTTGSNDVDTYQGHIYVKQADYAVVKNETEITFAVVAASVSGKSTQINRTLRFVNIYRKYKEHYFLHYARQSVDIVQSSARAGKLAEEQILVEMLVTNIEVDNPKVFKARVSDIDPSKVAYNKEYWENANVMLDDITE